SVTQQCGWKLLAGRFQMTLHADFHLAVLREPRGIDNRAARAIHRSPLPRDLDVRPAWTVTTLAINTLRQPRRKSRASLASLHLRLELNIAVMTRHTAIADLATETCVIRSIITGAHG